MAYPDAAPVMLMSEASVNDLSSKLVTGVSVCQFRPNIVASDCESFSEVQMYYSTNLKNVIVIGYSLM